MKVLLVHSYFISLDQAEQKVMKPYPPLGVLYNSAWLKQQGHEVEVFDGTFQTPEDFAPHVARFQPDVIGFYANMMTRKNVLMLRGLLDTAHDRLIVAGGPDPANYAEDYLGQGFDAVVLGEGEHPLAALAQKAGTPEQWKTIPGICFQLEGKVHRTPPEKPETPLDEFPFPDRKAIALDSYLDCWEKHHQMRPVSLITSRGCPYQCTWCSHSVYGYSLRKRTPENVLAELEEINTHWNGDHYWYADDVFTVIYDWVLQYRDLLQENPKLILPFETISRANRLTPEMVKALKDLKCHRLWVGAESGSQRLLDFMKRGVQREQIIQASNLLHQAGIDVGMFFMWGFHDEGLEDILETVSLVEQCTPELALTTVSYPIKGTPYYQQLEDSGRLSMLTGFREGTDRDIQIKGQQSRDIYQAADALLHNRLAAAKAKSAGGLQAAKAMVYQRRAHTALKTLQRAF